VPSLSFAHLTDRALIRMSGPDANHYLQNLVTSDMKTVDQQGAGSAALLAPQGKILFDFLIYKDGDSYLLDTPAAAADDLLKRLIFYKLRAKVEPVRLADDIGVFAVWGGEANAASAIASITDPRLPTLGQRVVGPVAALSSELGGEEAGLDAYDAHRIGLGVPEGLKDYDYSDIFPHDADLDQLSGVSFKKGCFVGQEVVARMQHRGTARKRFIQVESAGALPEKGSGVTVSSKSVGTLGSSAVMDGKSIGLALLRLDKVAQAKDNGNPLQCGDAELMVRLPEWATFTWPERTTTAD